MSGIEAIAAERRRQIEDEGWTAEHDDAHSLGEISGAAACYALSACRPTAQTMKEEINSTIRVIWPWDATWWKPKDRRSDLVRAGALIAAEIDRLDRATSAST